MTLLALQRDFAAFLRGGDADHAPPGMRIYQNNYRAQLCACLEDAFARTCDWIGTKAFEEAMIRHIRRIPPSSWTLDAYPRDFPDTLALLYPNDPEIPELAWLELALADAFVGPDAASLSPADAAKVDWEEAALHFVPTLDLRVMRSNAADLWLALAAGEAPPATAFYEERRVLIVWRQDQVSRFRLIDESEEQAILLARSGVNFAGLCQMFVAQLGEEAGIQLSGSYLGQWLATNLLDARFMRPSNAALG